MWDCVEGEGDFILNKTELSCSCSFSYRPFLSEKQNRKKPTTTVRTFPSISDEMKQSLVVLEMEPMTLSAKR